MTKSAQVLLLEPSNDLLFKGSPTHIATANLKLTNPSEKEVWFKIKTTAPQRYVVRPNAGILRPNKTVYILFERQPIDDLESVKDKFLVQSLFVQSDKEPQSSTDLWEKTSEFMETKLRTVFENTHSEYISQKELLETLLLENDRIEHKISVIQSENAGLKQHLSTAESLSLDVRSKRPFKLADYTLNQLVAVVFIGLFFGIFFGRFLK